MSNFNQNYDDFFKEPRKNRVRYLRVNENWSPQQQAKPRSRESSEINAYQKKHGEK